MKEDENAAKAHVERAFESTFRLIFKECNVTMDELEPYLVRFHYQPLVLRESAISGKVIALSTPRYPKSARFASQDEMDYLKKHNALGINEIKDVDSIIDALGERAFYAGNTAFGNSSHLGLSDNCSDSHYVYKSYYVVNSKYVGNSYYIREGSDHIFGASSLVNCNHIIKEIGGDRLSRVFEAYICFESSDLFFTSYCQGCTHAMFSFNLRAKKYCIGNLELPKDKYMKIREKLIDESREYLEKNKTFYSIFDYAPPTRNEIAAMPVPKLPKKESSMTEVEEAFAQTTKLIFGSELRGIRKYEKSLMAGGAEPVLKAKTPFGNETEYSKYYWAGNVPQSRMIDSAESAYAAKAHVEQAAAEDGNLQELVRSLSKIAFYPTKYEVGSNQNAKDTPIMYHSADICAVDVAGFSKKCAYCMHTFRGDSLFGCAPMMVDSSFCIRCHNCVKVGQSLELDACKSCFRSMFCHNCEGLTDSMFCFSAKNLKYAIGNVEVGREEYMRIRRIVVAELLSRLERTGDIGIDIYSIGARK